MTVTPPATTGETRPPDVIIAEFETRPGETVRVARRLEENLYEQLQIYGLSDVNVRVVNEPILDREQAEALTTELAGKVLIWGWYDDVGVRVRIHLPESNQDSLQAMRLRELPLEQAGSSSSELAFLVKRPLPQNVTFLSLFIIGQLRYQANEYQAGYAAFDAAMANLPETVIFENEALLHFFQARQLERSGEENAVEVICSYASAIVLDPDFAPAYNNLGVFLASQQLSPELYEATSSCLAALPFDYVSTTTLFNLAAELQPDSVLAAYNQLAWNYFSGFSSIAIETVDEMIARDPSIPGPYILSGILAVRENDLAKAESRFEAVIDRLPELRLNLSLVYLLQERPQAAQPILEQLLAENPADAEALLALAYLVYQEEGREPAQRYLEQVPPLTHRFTRLQPRYGGAGTSARRL
ncbi:MAG: tetratricopeptide repeat protein [Chloroflexi bacterium]|nr:tetratricopeptide repeat protein [Chloroflexota bacterium]